MFLFRKTIEARARTFTKYDAILGKAFPKNSRFSRCFRKEILDEYSM